MRKNIVFSLITAVCVVVLSFACVKTDATEEKQVASVENSVLTVAQDGNVQDKVLETRFLNMLNHNFVYDDAFYDDAALANASMLALLEVADGSFLDQNYLADYIFNMYGKIYKDFDFLGEALPQKDGFVYIIPRGYEVYTHEMVSLTANEDGSYTAVTNVEISYEDGSVEVLQAETLFIEAEESAFGYNILYSQIFSAVADAAC